MQRIHVVVLKVTSHFYGEGKTVEQALQAAKTQMATSLPHTDLDEARVATHQIRRAERREAN